MKDAWILLPEEESKLIFNIHVERKDLRNVHMIFSSNLLLEVSSVSINHNRWPLTLEFRSFVRTSVKVKEIQHDTSK